MHSNEFYYKLPTHNIAQLPSDKRGNSRLLFLDGSNGKLQNYHFEQIPELLQEGDLLVFNDTRVIPARLFGRKGSGGKVEIMLERIIDQNSFIAQIRASKSSRPGTIIRVEDKYELCITAQDNEMYTIELEGNVDVKTLFDRSGHIPLPPYIQRPDQEQDKERYQTVYAEKPGAVAAPTAGLHFTNEMMSLLEDCQIQKTFITLHVGAGTFQPVRTGSIEDHKMHSELIEVSMEVCEKINVTKKAGKRVIAVGTTTVRALETAAMDGNLEPFYGETDIFIYPGFDFKIVEAMITNFHLPESTLLMLVCAFAGKENILHAYEYAIDQNYRFYSYGDAMFITAN